MASYNRVILVGNLTRDIELKYTQGGTPVTDIGLAVKNGINIYTVRGEGRMSCHRALSLMEEGKINGEALITHTFPLEDINEALATFVERRDDALKVVVHP